MKRSLKKDTKDFQMFQEYWKIYQYFYDVEDTDAYWNELITALEGFSKKYGKFAYGIAKEYLDIKSEEYDLSFQKIGFTNKEPRIDVTEKKNEGYRNNLQPMCGVIYTSYFAKLRSLPENIVPISICGKAPSWYKGLQYKKLAPKYNFFKKWKENHDNAYYTEHFKEEVLDELDVSKVIYDLLNLSNNKTIALICYEKPLDFCHRHLVSRWLNENGFKSEEWG